MQNCFVFHLKEIDWPFLLLPELHKLWEIEELPTLYDRRSNVDSRDQLRKEQELKKKRNHKSRALLEDIIPHTLKVLLHSVLNILEQPHVLVDH